MNHEAKRLRIAQLTKAVRDATLKNLGQSGVEIGSRDSLKLYEQIAEWEATAKNLKNLIQSDEHWSFIKNSGGGRVPSYGQKQSIKSAQRNASGLRQQVALFDAAILELYISMAPPDGKVLMNVLEHLIEISTQDGDDLSLDPVQHHAIYQPIGDFGGAPDVPQGSLFGLLGISLVLFAMLRELRNRR